MKKQFTILSILIFAIFGCFALAEQINAETEVGGVINSNTTWSLESSPYAIINPIQVLYGATLTIEPGVIINNNSIPIQIGGKLNAIGASDSKIIFNNVKISGIGSHLEHFEMNIQFAELNSGSFYYWPDTRYGSLSLRDSKIQTGSFIYLSYPTDNCYIERNIFFNSGGISVGTNNSVKVYIRNNIFYSESSRYNWNGNSAIEVWNDYPSSETIIEYNSFLDINQVVLRLPVGYSGANMIASNNYWGTIDESAINLMIFDKNDDLRSANYINYLPILAEPHPNTPTLAICNSWIYSDWNDCVNRQQTRTIISSSPENCIEGNPVLGQSCQMICTSWTYSDWSSCLSNNQQTRSIVSSSPAGCADGNPVLSKSCTYTPPNCTSWIYSDWSSCSNNNQQTRSVISSSPNDCSGGNPILTQSCIYVLPTLPTCTSWIYSDWGGCINEQQTRNIISSSPENCIDGNPILSQTCQIKVETNNTDAVNKFLDNKNIINEIKSTIKTLSEILFNSDELLGVDQININDNFENRLGVKNISTKHEAINSYNLVKEEIDKLKELNLIDNNECINDAIKLTKNALLLMDNNLVDVIDLLGASIVGYDHPDIIDLKYFETTYNTNSLLVKSKIDIFNDGYKIFFERNKLEIPNQYNSSDNTKNEESNQYIVAEEKSLITKIDNNLSKRMSGNILLQVEKNGEGWYVNPDDEKKYYLGRPADAFSIMRKLGLGATHEFITGNTVFPDHVLGKILLDVEQNGEAYYIYPKDKKAYYLGRPADAFNVMRNLGLGITNDDIRKIDVGEIN